MQTPPKTRDPPHPARSSSFGGLISACTRGFQGAVERGAGWGRGHVSPPGLAPGAQAAGTTSVRAPQPSPETPRNHCSARSFTHPELGAPAHGAGGGNGARRSRGAALRFPSPESPRSLEVPAIAIEESRSPLSNPPIGAQGPGGGGAPGRTIVLAPGRSSAKWPEEASAAAAAAARPPQNPGAGGVVSWGRGLDEEAVFRGGAYQKGGSF